VGLIALPTGVAVDVIVVGVTVDTAIGDSPRVSCNHSSASKGFNSRRPF
jgi:hypothetical protein